MIAFFFNRKNNEWITFRLKDVFHPELQAVKEIYTIGFPSMITMGLTSMSSFCINQVLLGYSTTATAVYGIWLKLQNFCYMPSFGMNNGMVPILSYNSGNNKWDRVYQTIRCALTTILSLMLVLTIVLECIPQVLLTMFDASENMMAIGIPALRACILSLVFGGTCIILTSAMQALRHSRYTLIVNVLRGFLLPASLFFLMSVLFHDLNRLWIAVPLADIAAAAVSVFLYRKMKKDLAHS